ncbi:beta-1,6-N-acetylglucosaminyltransferase [Halomonas caseinilytica]|uniref:Peptide O-xylosyltransferase n=1 Tax=Halomonas caseinilytica TaxID=438744 RepID=A0A1M6NMN3_9GAMM|nr:beta-1,6-N-acetylglucosaminyltransferase [Halomonas caseinilytica]SHJ96999.1 Core-2/I-Branching enzyme [Halomonas caseinilytica]
MTGNTLVTVTFILLCHDSAERVITLVRQLLEDDPDCRILVHLDKKSPKETFHKLVSVLDDEPRCHLMRNRVRCGWGQWGLVEAPLRALRYAFDQEVVPDYFYLISEYCRPVRPLRDLREFLTVHQGMDFIECKTSEWIKGGIREDRYLYRHYLDKRKYPKLHRWMYRTQKRLGLKRREPHAYEIYFGSQWWCLSSSTAKKTLCAIVKDPKLRFFKTVWIPDECFFQTIVRLVSRKNVSGYSLTYSCFDNCGQAGRVEGKNLPCGFYFSRKHYL